jgi:hypothetical protein
MSNAIRTCPICSYDLRGHPRSRRCPECGARQPKRDHGPAQPSLAREPYRVIVACLWRAMAAGSLHALAVVALVLAPMGGTLFDWSLASLPLLMAAATAIRSSTRWVAPTRRSGKSGRGLRAASLMGSVVLGVVGVWSVAWVASGTPDPWLLAWMTVLPTIVVGTVGVWTGISLDEWALDDRAERLHGLSMWAVAFAVIGGVGLMAAAAFFGGGWHLPNGFLFLAAVAWWGLIFLGDLSITSALIWCIRHRAHYEEVSARLRGQEQVDRVATNAKRRAMDGE